MTLWGSKITRSAMCLALLTRETSLLHVISLVDDPEAVKTGLDRRAPADAARRRHEAGSNSHCRTLSDFACGDGNFVHSNQARRSAPLLCTVKVLC